jgi:predicted 2-oxoglutarate/Fe(II)-dependent dioxygenase YbiX
MPSFVSDKYTHLKAFLDLENCAELTTELKRLVDEGKTVKDEQCPLSEAIHGAPVFDSLLEQLLPHFEQASGKKLYPTYAYARLYKKGDELKAHTDRSACEISATITLGFEGKPWSIYMADKCDDGETYTDSAGSKVKLGNIAKIDMEVGDAVMYRGMEKYHWRNKFEGEWQAQVFLHYVDANGKHADQKYDGRGKLNSNTQPDEMLFVSYADGLPLESCDKLIASTENYKTEKAGIGTSVGVVDTKIRDVNKINLPSYRGIGAAMAGMGMNANHKAWQFDITHSNQTDYLKYDEHGHYQAHIDTFMSKNTECRKLTVLAFLNDDFEGGRLFLQTGQDKIYPPQAKGTVLVFPSFVLHGVEPVTKGIRRSVVTWLVGPFFK